MSEGGDKLYASVARIEVQLNSLVSRIDRLTEDIKKSIDDHEVRIRKIEEDNTKDHEDRLKSLENWRSMLIGKIAVIVLVFGTLITIATAWITTWH